MRERQSAISGLSKDLRDRDKTLAESNAAIVEKDRLIAQLREHLREEAEWESEEDGTRSPRRTVFSRVNESLEEDIANMRTLLAESTNNLEATRRERDTLSRKHQELLQDCQRRQSLLKKQESTMDTQRKDIIALREDVNRLRDKYDEARDKLRDSEDAYGLPPSSTSDLRLTGSMVSWRMRKGASLQPMTSVTAFSCTLMS
jgi:chromosome segregation ATPase